MDEGNSSKKIMQYAEGDLLKKSVMRCDYGEIFIVLADIRICDSIRK